MEQRLIDANTLCERLADRALEYSGLDECTENTIKEDMHIVHTMPTIDARPVVPGRWVQVMRWSNKAKYRCSVCGREIMSATKVNIEKYPYCHCGAQMDGGDENGGADSED